VTQLARPLPVEYLLVDLPAAFPVDPAFTFYADENIRPFAVAHRSDIGEIQVHNLILFTYYRVTTNLEKLEYPGISLNMENSGNSLQPQGKYF